MKAETTRRLFFPNWASAYHQLHAAEATADEMAQKLGPEGLGLGGTDRHAQNLAPAVRIDADSKNNSNGYDPPTLAHL